MHRRTLLSFVPKLAALTAAPGLLGHAWAQEGLSSSTVTLGCSGALTGPLGGLGADLKLGVDAAMGQINAKGGIHGRKLQFQMMDDAYVPQRSLDNVRKMSADNSVLALLSCMGTPNNALLLPAVEEAGIPYVAPLTGASSLRRPDARQVFHVRASYTDETRRLVQRLVGMEIRNLGIVYLDNSFGKEVLADATRELEALGLKASSQVSLAADGKNLPAVLQQVLAAKPGAVLLGTAGAVSVGLIAGLKKASPLLPMAGLSVALSSDGLRQLGTAGQGLALSMVFPDPARGKTAVARNYQAAMRAAGQQAFSQGSFEAYINTLVMAEGLERAGRELTRSKLRQALASVRNLDLGGFSVDFSAAAPYVGSRFVDLGVLSATGQMLG
jgi:ABC-type branched-subunit amino acid transport system substrate-binding protein